MEEENIKITLRRNNNLEANDGLGAVIVSGCSSSSEDNSIGEHLVKFRLGHCRCDDNNFEEEERCSPGVNCHRLGRRGRRSTPDCFFDDLELL